MFVIFGKESKKEQKRKAGFMNSGPRLYLRLHIEGIIIGDVSDFCWYIVCNV